jgi:C4-dicarboxylate transporter DctQ subunit
MVAFRALLSALSRLNGLLLLGLSVMIVVDITYRALFGRPILGVFEISEVLLLAITFLAIAHVQLLGRQLRIDILSGRAHGRLAGFLQALDAVAGLAFFGILLWMAGTDWLEALAGEFQGRGMLQIPLAVPLGLIAIGTALMILALLLQLGRSARHVATGQDDETSGI